MPLSVCAVCPEQRESGMWERNQSVGGLRITAQIAPSTPSDWLPPAELCCTRET